ncbi:hypothetical protein SVAN01_02695 [Stagonosporopsis vannaccii]|nr:hypothetical protein SVAN01_02695 [Stagonosporopsis vannaccii]
MPIAGTVMLLLWRGHLVASKLDGQHVVNGSVDARREVGMEARGTAVDVRARAVERSTPSRSDNVGFDQRVRATSPNTALRVRLHTKRYFIQIEALASLAASSPEGVGMHYASAFRYEKTRIRQEQLMRGSNAVRMWLYQISRKLDAFQLWQVASLLLFLGSKACSHAMEMPMPLSDQIGIQPAEQLSNRTLSLRHCTKPHTNIDNSGNTQGGGVHSTAIGFGPLTPASSALHSDHLAEVDLLEIWEANTFVNSITLSKC